MSHTKEPWVAVGAWVENPNDDEPDICNCDPAAMGQEGLGQSYDTTCANASRIATCVNACAGIADPINYVPLTVRANENLTRQLANSERRHSELQARLEVVGEVAIVSRTYDRVRAEQAFAVDDLEYDLFSAGWKAAIKAMKGSEL